MVRVRVVRALSLLTALALGCSDRDAAGGGSTPPPGACPVVDALELVSSSPADQQTGVSVSATIAVRFNTCVDPRSISASQVVLRRSSGAAVSGAARWDGTQAAVVFEPSSPLAFGASYVFAASGLAGVHGEPLAAPVLIAFRTRSAPDLVPPTTTATPPGGRYATPQSVTLACVDDAGGTGCVGTFYTLDGTAPTAASARYLAPIAVDRSLVVRFFSVDGDGNAEAPRAADYVIDTIPPHVATVEPAAGATEVRLDAPVRVTFDEPMRALTTVTALSVAPAAPGAPALDPAGNVLERLPTERYRCATTYQVSVAGTATDLAGNGLGAPAPYTWSFTTSSDCDEPRTTASVASGAYAAAQSVTLTCDDGALGSGCARIVYTLDGSLPTFSPPHGTIVTGGAAGPISIGTGETVLRFRAEDAAGHLEVVRERRYSVSTTGFTWLASSYGLARGGGAVPASFVPVRSYGKTRGIFRDGASGRLYRVTDSAVVFSDDGVSFLPLAITRTDGATSTSATAAAAWGSRIYVGTWDGLLVSTNDGASFRTIHLGQYESDHVVLVVANGDDVFVSTETALHVSHDGFRTAAVRSGGAIDLALDGDHAYAVAPNGTLMISRDGGDTWSGTQLPAGAGLAHAVAVLNDRVYVGTDGGMTVLASRGDTGIGSVLPLDGNPVNHVAAGDGRIYASSRVAYSTAPSAFWVSTDANGGFVRRRIPGGTTRDADVYAVHVEGADVHVGAYPSYWISHDHGATFALADLPGSDARRVVAVGARVYAAIDDSSGFGGLVVSTDRGTTFTWRGIEAGLPDGSIDDLFVDGATVYAGTWRGLGISSDDGATWNVRTQANSNLFSSAADAIWASGSSVWVAAMSKLQRSKDGGATFADLPLGTYVTPAELAVGGANAYLGGSDGVYVSNDGGGTFARRTTANGLSAASIRDLDLAADGTLFVVTTSGFDRSADAGASFAPVTLPSGVSPYAVSTCGGVLVVGGSTIALSTDGGATFATRTWREGVPGSLVDACYAAP